MKHEVSRRSFLRGTLFGSVGAIITSRMGWLFPESQPMLARATDAKTSQSLVEGEVYEGFLLLPEDAPMPESVQCAPAPILCMEDGQSDPAFIGEVIRFNSIEELINHISFPIYIPATLPSNLRFDSANVIRFAQSGDIFVATINFSAISMGQSRISVRARPVYPRPYPVWPVHSPASKEKSIVHPEKVTFLPTPGVMRPSATGHVLNWIQEDVQFTLVAEHNPNREAAVDIAKSLVRR